MMQANRFDFFCKVGAGLGIWPAEAEPQEAYIHRVILSAVSKWLLTAVLNSEGKTSVTGVLRSTREKMSAFLEIASLSPVTDSEAIVQHVYNTLLLNGMFYHQRDWLLPMDRQLIGQGNVAIVRGMHPDDDAFFSGLAPCASIQTDNDVTEAFDLWNMPGMETIDLVWKRSAKTESGIRIEEWLNLSRRNAEPYYLGNRRDQNTVTLGRKRKSQIPNDYDYYIVRGMEIRRITEDYVENAMHDNLRVAIMNSFRPQKVRIKNKMDKVDVAIEYLPSRHDVRFIKLLSWPADLYSPDNPFMISVHPDVFPLLERRFRNLGYQLEEIK